MIYTTDLDNAFFSSQINFVFLMKFYNSSVFSGNKHAVRFGHRVRIAIPILFTSTQVFHLLI